MSVPRRITLVLLSALVLQFLWHGAMPGVAVRAENLIDPPDPFILRLSSLGETIVVSRFMMLYLQSADIQPGVIIPYRDLDYGSVAKWLEASSSLDERDQYPLFAATYLYAEVKDNRKKRLMLDFIRQAFMKKPDERWQWLARGALIAKYELHDLPLALEYSESLRMHATGRDVPHWITQMSVFTLEDMNELDSAKIMLGGLLANGTVTDPNELLFLKRELEGIKKRQTLARQVSKKN